jgi:hypothetical protein
MKKLILLFSFLLTLSAKAQTNVYHPFPDSNAVWTVGWGYSDPGPPACSKEAHFSYLIAGDTLINSIIYNKINSPYCDVIGGFCGVFPYCGNNYAGAIREDMIFKKIWFIPPGSNSEELLYDFNLNVGDTVHGTIINGCENGRTIMSKDSILLGGICLVDNTCA